MADSRTSSQRDLDVAGVLALVFPAIVLFASFLSLGFYVTQHGEPAALWNFARAIHGDARGVAWFLTNLGFAYVLAPLWLLCLVVAIVSPRWRLPALFVVAVALACWGLTDYLQHYFARPRRLDWIFRHERAYSYPSSHASICTGFYFLWGVVLLRSHLAPWLRVGAFVLLALLTGGIMWSRVALGAHYPTDVIGGAALGLAVILVGAALLRTSGRPLFRR